MDFHDKNYHLASTPLSNGFLPQHHRLRLVISGDWVLSEDHHHPPPHLLPLWIPHAVAQKLAEKKQMPQLFPHCRDDTQEAQEPFHWETLWEKAIPRKVSTHCLPALDQAPSQKRMVRGWEVEMKVSLMALLPCDFSRIPRCSRPSQSSAIICRASGTGCQRKTFRSALETQKAHRCWSGMETTGAQWLPFVPESLLSYSRVSLVHESILSYSWVFPFQQWHPTNASQRAREHFVHRSAHVLNYLGLCRLRSFQSAALQADASESTTFFQGLFLPFLGDACLSSSVAFFNASVSWSQDTQEQATWERELE